MTQLPGVPGINLWQEELEALRQAAGALSVPRLAEAEALARRGRELAGKLLDAKGQTPAALQALLSPLGPQALAACVDLFKLGVGSTLVMLQLIRLTVRWAAAASGAAAAPDAELGPVIARLEGAWAELQAGWPRPQP